jgi:hypothetical protein
MPEPSLRETLAWAGAFVAYVALGYWTKGLVLNWIVGPLFPLLVLVVVPRALGRRSRGGSTP